MSNNLKKISSAKTIGTFLNGRACSDTLFHVINNAYDKPMKEEEKALPLFAGGIMQHGFQCGLIWGAALAGGAEVYRHFGTGTEAETRAVIAAQKLVESFQTQNNHINCSDITDLDKSSSTMDQIKYFLLKGGSIGCFRMAAKYAPEAFTKINTSLADEDVEIPNAPVSCSALLAKKMGVSDEHKIMVAGLAGGIGLSGEVCGALGAAIWIIGMKMQSENKIDNLWSDKDFNKKFSELMDRFLKKSDFEFECAKIVGRKFKDVNDHASYICEGGCSGIIEELAAG